MIAEPNAWEQEVERRLRDLESGQRSGLASSQVNEFEAAVESTHAHVTVYNSWQTFDEQDLYVAATGRRFLVFAELTVHAIALSAGSARCAQVHVGIRVDGLDPANGVQGRGRFLTATNFTTVPQAPTVTIVDLVEPLTGYGDHEFRLDVLQEEVSATGSAPHFSGGALVVVPL